MSAVFERFRSPGRRAVRDAGPPVRDIIAGTALAAAVIAAGWLAGPLRTVPWPLWMAIPTVILTVVAVLDRDGWNVRRAMAYVAVQQRARWTRGQIPATPSLARAWLDDPANADAHPLERMSVLTIAGDVPAARAILDSYVPTIPVHAVAMVRLRSYLAALETGTVDVEAVRAAAASLDEDDRRYQVTAAAFAQVWLDIEAGRPWRRRFADAVRDLGPFPVRPLFLAIMAVQQLAVPVAIVLATAIMAPIVGW